MMRRESKRKHNNPFDEDLFNELIIEKSLQWGDPGDYIGWIEKDNILLLDRRGFPLRRLPLNIQNVKETPEFLQSLAIKGKKPDFFLGASCEILYKIFRHLARLEKKSEGSIREIFFFRQMTHRSGEPSPSLDKVLALGTGNAEDDQGIKNAMASVVDIKCHEEYAGSRLELLTGGISIPERELSCTYFISSLFKRIFDFIRNKHQLD
jgi:hypothetical protein